MLKKTWRRFEPKRSSSGQAHQKTGSQLALFALQCSLMFPPWESKSKWAFSVCCFLLYPLFLYVLFTFLVWSFLFCSKFEQVSKITMWCNICILMELTVFFMCTIIKWIGETHKLIVFNFPMYYNYYFLTYLYVLMKLNY